MKTTLLVNVSEFVTGGTDLSFYDFMKKKNMADLSYRPVDDMFTAFYPNTPTGEEAWKIMAAQNGGMGKVLTVHVKNTLQQLRDAGYSVSKDTAPLISADELLAALAA